MRKSCARFGNGGTNDSNLFAGGLAADTAAEILVILFGLLSVVGVLVAQAEGAGRDADAGLAARQGLIVATALICANVYMLVRNVSSYRQLLQARAS